MEYVPYTIKWLELILRWGHILFAILWVGNSFLFNFLDPIIYTELQKSNEEKKIQMVQMMREEGLKAFEIWDKKTDKTKY